MDFGDVWMALGIDLQVLQGAVTFLYKHDATFQVIEKQGEFRLELAAPLIEARPACGDKPYRIGIHLLGNLFIANIPDALMFDAWVRLAPGVVTDATSGQPKGSLSFVEVESVTPAGAKGELEKVFAADGAVGKALAKFNFDVFGNLLDAATRILHPPPPDADPEAPVSVDPSEFAVDFWPAQPSAIRRPVYVVGAEGDPELDLDVASVTVPAVVATVALAGTSPRMVGDPSIVRPGTGLVLVTTKAMFDAKLALESAATEHSKIEGLTIDHLDLHAVDSGISVDGAGHKTGATVTFAGVMVARYQGGTDGHLIMDPAIHTDVDTAGWVTALTILGFALFPLVTLIAADVLVWGPVKEAPGKIDNALQEKFSQPLLDAANKLAAGFGVDSIPAAAFLADLWFFDGNFAVAAAAFLGATSADIRGVTYDTAYVLPDPPPAEPHRRHRRPVKSVAEITLTTGHSLTPWQAAALVHDGLVELPGYHAVHQPRARGEWYLRSNPNDRSDDNLVR